MKKRLLNLLAVLALTAVLPRVLAQQPASAEINQVIAQAATYSSGQPLEPFRRIEALVAQAVAQPALRPSLEAGLVQLLGANATFEARRFACKQLGIIGSQTALPALAALLPEDQTAGIACLALTTYPPGKADETLRAALGTARGAALIQIIHTLGDRRDAKAVKLLAQSACDTDASIAAAAIVSLGKIGNPAAYKALTALRQETSPALQAARTEALLRCAGSLAATGSRKTAMRIYEDLLGSSQQPHVRRSALAALIPLDKDQGQARIRQVLSSSDSLLKPVAIAAVRSVRAKNASEQFATGLPHLQPQEQAWLIESLAARGDAPARRAIGKSLASPEPLVRAAAIAALGQIGGAASVPLFAHALTRSQSAEERRAIESALFSLGGGTETDKAILAELGPAFGNARAHLIAALARRQGPGATPVLLKETANSDAAVARAAFRALGKTASGADAAAVLEKLLQTRDAALSAEAASAAAQVLAKVEEPSRRSALVSNALGQAQTLETREALLGLLAGCGDAQALAALKTAASDSNRQVRDAAVRALADWPDASAWDALCAIYRQPESESVRSIALRGLVRLAGESNARADAQLVERYRQLIAGAKGAGDLKLILGALAGAAHPEALQLALAHLANAGVRAEAEVAVKKIAESIKAQHPQTAREALEKMQH